MGTNTGLGIGIGIPFKNFSSGGRQPLPPDLKASLKGVWIAYGKTNEDSDRDTIRNLVDPDNPFIASNFAYTDGSGYAVKDSPYYGALVTDGVDDLIMSTKTLEEMIGDSNDLTVISMIHQISPIQSDTIAYNNYFRGKANNFVARNSVKNYGKTGIYGYSVSDLSSSSAINTILGDKEDYRTQIVTYNSDKNNVFSVEGFLSVGDGIIAETSQVAWYWTFIANRVLTTDEINQVIAYYNLDRCVEPTVLYDIKRQGLSNDTPDSDWYLKDFSKNGFDMSLFNFAKKGGSGVAAKQGESIKDYSIIKDEEYQELTIYNEFKFKIKSKLSGRYWTVQYINRTNTSYPVTIVIDKDAYWVNSTTYYDADNNKQVIRKNIPIAADTPTNVLCYGYDQFDIPEDAMSIVSAVSYIDYNAAGEITVEFIPSCKGGLITDGVNDFGQFVGDLGLKDYTLIMNRAYNNLINNQVPLVSSNIVEDQTPFIVEHWNTGSNAISFSYGASRTTDIPLDINKKIVYQSTYSYMGYVIPKGNAISTGGGITLGKFGNGVQYSAICLWSLMLFPYSMSEFLIERQLKKHKLGTLYPNMVEFRPIIPEDENITRIDYFVVNSGKWTVIKPGDYVDVGTRFVLNVYTKFPYKVEKASSLAFTGMSVGASTRLNVFDVKGYIKDKTPQKIKLTLAVNEDIVQWNPTITSNLLDSFTVSSWYLNDWDNTLTEGTWIKKTDKVFFKATFKTELYGLETATFGGTECVVSKADNWSDSINIWDIRMLGTIGDLSQVFNLDVYELIRFEDIVQPYPLFFEFTDENGNLISWGGKAKVGSTITRSKSVSNANILAGLYNTSNYKLNGKPLEGNSYVVEKQMVFTCTATYLFDNNEPKCILSPSRLRIPNSSYKLLGYIPDISGHGNNGVIHNSAYVEGSGVNEDGSYQFDGVDDFVTIPTLSSGGKQMLMKVNWNSLNHVLYDQRNNAEAPFCIVAASGTIAYNQRNVGGNTYIDGILNNHILVDDLQAITHNIVLNNDYNVANSNSFIGTNYTKSIYAQMALYDFMLFDDISTDDKIKELNEYVGVEAKVELPPYYWDTYGKTNSDADRDTIQQRGVAVGDYDLINYNHAYEGMSGYNGYPVVFGANKTWEILSSVYSYISDVTSTTIHVTMVKNAGTGLLFSYVKKDGALTNIKEIPAFRVTVKGLEGNSKFGYRYLATEDATKETLVYLGNGTHELAKSFAPTEALLDLTSNAWVGIFITPMVEDEAVFDCDITIEVLPEYKNGLVYDAITDYSKNANIPALDDFTAIIKREWLKKQGCPLIKGSKVYEGGNGNALLLEWDKAYNFVFYKRTDIMEGELPDNISFITPTNYNGNVITRGSEQDTNGICIAGDGNAGFANMVFYKLILYPKTIPLLQINFLKNLMERDEIIDLNNPIFIKNE